MSGESKDGDEPLRDQELPPPASVVPGLIEGKWHRFVLYQLMQHGPLRYNELKAELDGISDNSLTRALDFLEEKQLVHREVIGEKPVRVEYSLTEAGTALESVFKAVIEWERTYAEVVTGEDKFE